MTLLLQGSLALHLLCVQTEPLAATPVAPQELLDELKDAPKANAEREGKLVELFKQAGATLAELKLVPIAERAAYNAKRVRDAYQKQLEELGTPSDQIGAAVAALAERQKKLGRNVVAVIPGKTDRVLGFAAHVDVCEDSPGVIDDWSGCVLLANLYQAYHESEPRHTLWFVGFAESEMGCLGSLAFVNALSAEQAAKIDAFVTIECAGVASPIAWWGGSSASVAELVSDAAKRAKVPFTLVDFPGTSSDSLAFRMRNVPQLALLGVDPPHVRLLHGPRDAFESIDAQKLGEMYSLLVASVAEFDPHSEQLQWPYVKEKLDIGPPPHRRYALAPVKIDLSAAPKPKPPAPQPTPPNAPAPQNSPAKNDGSHRP